MTDRGPGILTKIIVTEQDINDIISCLDPQKASGPDDISHRMLIATKNTICRSSLNNFTNTTKKRYWYIVRSDRFVRFLKNCYNVSKLPKRRKTFLP
jgi:hypothetical protein